MRVFTRASVSSLTVYRCRVMGAIEELFIFLGQIKGSLIEKMNTPPTYKFLIRYDTGIELDLDSFRMISRTRTNLLVGWVDYQGIATYVSNSCRKDSFLLRYRVMLQENMLDTPKAAPSEISDLRLNFS
jgi:hypothetical protein